MDVTDNAVCAALDSCDRPRRKHPRPLLDPELLTLVRDNVFGCDLSARDAGAVTPWACGMPAPRLAVA